MSTHYERQHRKKPGQYTFFLSCYDSALDVWDIRASLTDVMGFAFDVFFMRGTRGINRKSSIYDVSRKDTMTIFIHIYHVLRVSEIYVTRTFINHQLNAQFLYSLITSVTLYSSTCFEHRCAHLQEEKNCMPTVSGIVTFCKLPYHALIESGLTL